MSVVKKPADNLRALIGLCLFAFVMASLIDHPSQWAALDSPDQADAVVDRFLAEQQRQAA
jgi:hypothetical protein